MVLLKAAAKYLPYYAAEQQRALLPAPPLLLRCFVSLARHGHAHAPSNMMRGYARRPRLPRRSTMGSQQKLKTKDAGLYGSPAFNISVKTPRQCLGVCSACLRIFSSSSQLSGALQARAFLPVPS